MVLDTDPKGDLGWGRWIPFQGGRGGGGGAAALQAAHPPPRAPAPRLRQLLLSALRAHPLPRRLGRWTGWAGGISGAGPPPRGAGALCGAGILGVAALWRRVTRASQPLRRQAPETDPCLSSCGRRARGGGAAGEDAGAVGPAVRLRAQGGCGRSWPPPHREPSPALQHPRRLSLGGGQQDPRLAQDLAQRHPPLYSETRPASLSVPGMRSPAWEGVKGSRSFAPEFGFTHSPPHRDGGSYPILTLLLEGLPSAFLPPASQLATDAQSSFGHAPSASMTTPTPGFLSTSWLALS